ncbi:MAG: TatD family hydrolase [Lachnospiraceae bacterium]|nr:TatD family hydrolase [Lachnospiraceae bacterium]
MIFETHAHYDDAAFDLDRNELLSAMPDSGIGTIINVGASLKSTEASIKLADKYAFIYAAAGVHPSETAELTEENFKWLEDQCHNKKVVAVGEIGLDYYWDEPGHEIQKFWFQRQLDLAHKINKPVIIHSRDAAKDTFDILASNNVGRIGGVIHCFSYSTDFALHYVEMGLYIGIGGVVTFKNGKKLKEVVEAVPIEKILLETDSPYLAPEPNRGKRNSSLNIPYIAQMIAEIKGLTYDKVVKITEENARRMYQIL